MRFEMYLKDSNLESEIQFEYLPITAGSRNNTITISSLRVFSMHRLVLEWEGVWVWKSLASLIMLWGQVVDLWISVSEETNIIQAARRTALAGVQSENLANMTD